MNDSTQDDPRACALADFIERLEKGEDPDALEREFSQAHPNSGDDFRDVAAMYRALSVSGAAEQPPPRLPDFRIKREVARGGMGVVYEAEQLSLKRRVALKLRHGWLNPESQARFEREQQTLAVLHQTHIVPIHTAGQEGEWQYFAMKFIDGAPLQHLVGSAWTHSTNGHAGNTPPLSNLAAKYVKTPHGAQDAAASVLPSVPIQLSMEYWRSVARTMADIADALQHAHDAHILHRDIKPSNIMVETTGESWLIDFGLSRLAAGAASEQPTPGAVAETNSGDSKTGLTRGPLGTPEYMAPEQFQGHNDERTDVWGLGVTLYELLSLRRAFAGPNWQAIKQQVESEEPTPLERLIPDVPKDLAAICLKAMGKNATDRYATAGEVSADLRRWLGMEPTKARPAWPLRRLALWSRRNKALAASIAFAAIAVLGLVIAVQRVAAQKDRNRTLAAEAAGFDLVSDIQGVRTSEHTEGWSRKSWAIVEAAADGPRTDILTARLRDQATATLAGLDVRKAKHFDFDGSSVTFDTKGKRLLIGGLTDFAGRPREQAKLWNLDAPVAEPCGRFGSGPVGFQPDGAAVQLTWIDSQRLVLWDIARDRAVHEWTLPEEADRDAPGHSPVSPLALSLDGLFSAAALARPDGTGAVLVWDNTTGKLTNTLACAATVITFAHDNSLIATGDATGVIALWSTRDGGQVASLKNGRTMIYSLDLTADARLVEDGDRSTTEGRLAAGDGGSLATIWDLRSSQAFVRCRGAQNWVYAVAFSPDGTMLAAGGRDRVRIFETATGQQLLRFLGGNDITGIRFSPDGTHLAVSSQRVFAPGGVSVWKLENGRGVSSYYGLDAPLEWVVFSRDERWMAALSHNGQIGLWEAASGQLRFRFDVPHADYVDNTGLMFSPDGKRLTYVGQEIALVWDTETGKEVGEPLRLNPALGNRMTYRDSGELMVLRVETQTGSKMPDSRTKRETDPRVFRVYHLNGPDSKKVLHELPFSDTGVADPRTAPIQTLASPDGTYFVVEARLFPPGGKPEDGTRFIKAYDSLTGRELLAISTSATLEGGSFALQTSGRDTSGRFLTVYFDAANELGSGNGTVLEMPSGKVVGTVVTRAPTWSPTTLYYGNSTGSLYSHDGPPNSIHYVSGGRLVPAIRYVDSAKLLGFSPSGKAWVDGTPTGTVRIYDSSKIQRKLAEVGLGW